MKRVLVFLFFVFCFSFAFAGSVEDEFRKLSYYAEEYEAGDIDYSQLVVYLSFVRENLNEEFGAVGSFEGGLLKQEQIESVLGRPSEKTRWVWIEGEERDEKVDEPIPAWRKIVFDGSKIRIRIEAWPSVFSKKKFEGDEFSKGKEKILKEFEGQVIYRLHFDIEFKKDEKVDFGSDVERVKGLAEDFSEGSVKVDELAEESFKVERRVEEYLRNGDEKCEDFMAMLFGREYQQSVESRTVYEIEFFDGEDFDAIMNMNMCDDCEWNWLNVDFRIESRKNMNFEGKDVSYSKDRFSGYDFEDFEDEAKEKLAAMGEALGEEDFGSAYSIFFELRVLNEAWNEKGNQVWEQVDREYKDKVKAMSETERQRFNEDYGWIKMEQEKRAKVKELSRTNYDLIKSFYLNYFAGYDVREYSFEERRWEKRLVELFSVFGREVCDNNIDDNGDGSVDCADSQCGGAVCGKSVVGDESAELYCISGGCSLKGEEILSASFVCGNHICEENESVENCAEDCSLCPDYEAVSCSDGKVIFSGVDENRCLMEPICVEEGISGKCEVSEDCRQPLCGVAECVKENPEDEFGECKVSGLKDCEEAQCVDGVKNFVKCSDGKEMVSSICEGGVLIDLDVECEGKVEVEDVNDVEEIFDNECVTKSDCGGENDVCSNGKCVVIPKKIVEEDLSVEGELSFDNKEVVSEKVIENVEETTEGDEGIAEERQSVEEKSQSVEEGSQSIEEEKKEVVKESEEESSLADLTGAVVSKLVSVFSSMTGRAVEDSGSSDSESSGSSDDSVFESDLSSGNSNEEGSSFEDSGNEIFSDEENLNHGEEGAPNDYEESDKEREGEDRRAEEERRKEEDRKRCENDCERPCVEDCIRENCGEKMDCDVDSESKVCEEKCEPEESCIEKCVKGEDWWKDYEKEQKVENGVFNVGGSCRKIQDKEEEGGIWFGGWGEPFDEVHLVKSKYYTDGNENWCKSELKNSVKIRKEFEKGFDEDFAKWFFEKYLASSAGDWEQAVSGIYEVYWSNVDNMMRIARDMKCVGVDDVSDVMDYKLINFSYDTSYGRIEYWEEVMDAEMPEFDGKVRIVSPYMKIWVFPSEEFLKYEMKKSMENHEFPGSPEEKANRENEEGLTSDEKARIKGNSGAMKKIGRIIKDYDGSLNGAVQLVDGDDVIFNIYVEVNEQDLVKMTPMLPAEVPEQDVSVKVDFNLVYDMVYNSEREMQGGDVQSPPWDEKRGKKSFVKNAVDGIKMYFRVRKIVNSAEYFPSGSEKDMKDLIWIFLKSMGDEEKGTEDREQRTDFEDVDVEGVFGGETK